MLHTNTLLIAVEGVCNAGKSTLIHRIHRELQLPGRTFPDYADMLDAFPMELAVCSKSTAERIAIVELFASLDAERFAQIRRERLYLLDRSIFTLIAHSYAEERLSSYPALEATIAYLKQRDNLCWPDLTIFVDAERSTLHARAKQRPPPGLLGTAEYNELFIEYFRNIHHRYFHPVFSVVAEADNSLADIISAIRAILSDIKGTRDEPPSIDHQLQGWIAVDLDGTLAQYDGWKSHSHIGPPVPRMLMRVKTWLAEGREVRIFTGRVSPESLAFNNRTLAEALQPIREWCREFVGCELLVTHQKDLSMTELWDDRCVQIVRNTGERVDGHP